MIPVEFRGDVWHKKTGVLGLLCGTVGIVLAGLGALVEHRPVTDGRAQGHSTYRATTASGGKTLNKLKARLSTDHATLLVN